jgi:hypothetical protein
MRVNLWWHFSLLDLILQLTSPARWLMSKISGESCRDLAWAVAIQAIYWP